MTTDDKKPADEHGTLTSPTDAFAAATAVGFAMASEAMSLWFGVLSGVARASQEILERHKRDGGSVPPAYAPGSTSAAAAAEAARRTVMAEFERATQAAVETAKSVAEGREVKTPEKAPPEKAQRAAKPESPKADAPAANVVGLTSAVAAKSGAAADERSKPSMPVQQKPVQTKRPAAPPQTSLPLQTEQASAAEQPTTVASLAVAPVAPQEPATTPAKDLAGSAPAVGKARAPAPATKVAAKKAEKPAAAPKPKATEPAKVTQPAPTALLPEDFRAPKAIDRPAIPDDLKLLPGVGPKLEQVLNGMGVWTHAQVAAWTPAEIAYVEDTTGLNGRIAQDKWLERAATLARGATKH